MIKVWFHLHSEYSQDSSLSLEKIVRMARKNGIKVVILTDHNNLIPKEKIEENKEVRIIAGEEIKTKQGEIIGIFLKEKIQPNFSLQETIKKIKEQNALVIVPHPFDLFRRKKIKKKALLENIAEINIVEIFNARNILEFSDKKAENFAKKYNKLAIAGSDAHSVFEINKTSIEMENFEGADDFLAKLKKARFYTKRSNIFVHLLSVIFKILKKKLN